MIGGYRYSRIKKGIEGQELGRRCCLQTCVARAKTVVDQLEAVRGERNHAPKKKYKQLEQRVQWIKDKMSA